MQSHNSNNKCTEESNIDGGRNTEQSPSQNKAGLVHQEVSNMVNRTVHLSANLKGSGGLKSHGI